MDTRRLETGRLLLRPFGPADLEALLNAAEGLCRACALEMFRYGRQLAPEREK